MPIAGIIVFMLNFMSVHAEEKLLIPCGTPVGIKVYTEGLLVVGVSSVTNSRGEKEFPAGRAGIGINDRILSIDNVSVNDAEQFSGEVDRRREGFYITFISNGETKTSYIKPSDAPDGSSKIGIWVRDSTAGIGTITYIDPEDNSFAALGHGINDVDTGNILTLKSGNIQKCNISSVTKGTRGIPGEINGVFEGEDIGNIEYNSPVGIFGKIKSSIDTQKAIPCAEKEEIYEGDAYILSDIDGEGVKSYGIKIKKIDRDRTDNKAMTVSVCDDRLTEKTGGIIQGMSGSPLVQNGKLIGAVTHVFVNDPTRGYGIFIENMLAEAEKIK